MNNHPGLYQPIALCILALFISTIACSNPLFPYSDCEAVERSEYVEGARMLGQKPETPQYPQGATYKVCYTDGQLTSVQMKDGQKSDQKKIKLEGTYTGKATFYTTLEDDADYSYLEPVCSENYVRVVIGSDGAVRGEVRSICYASQDTENEDMQMTHHSEVNGVIEGTMPDVSGQLTISFTWRSYFTSPQWDTPSLDQTVEPEFLYNVAVSNGKMTLTPAADVEDYYSFNLDKE